ncbi:MAG: T9SS type A sorting domain-containing protein [Chitinophagales bacterium]|nr:T9SS type A sorting domain-containing protein [Chitinophagales bacterium]
MRSIIQTIILAILFHQAMHAATLRIIDPQQNWNFFNGYIDNVEMEISPVGSQVQVELTFSLFVDSINKSNSYYGILPTYLNSMLEMQMNFDLPANAYVYDSYLWLDNTTIIRAAITSRMNAINIYEGIVKRQRDPSILLKNTSTNYSFNVYPIATNFSRKVKLVYTVPFEFNSINSEMIPLPNNVLQFMHKDAVAKIKINNTTNYSFTNAVFPLKHNSINNTPQSAEIEIHGSFFKKQSISYLEMSNASKNPVIFNYYPMNASQGYYELKVHNALLNNVKSNTKVFNYALPFTGTGIVYDKFNSSSNTLISNEDFIESGRYEGTFNLGDSIVFNYKVDNTFYQIKVPMHTNPHLIIQKNWVNAYCNNNPNTQESNNLSLMNRVLTSSTAFLALETGDTVKTPVNSLTNQGGGGMPVEINNPEEDAVGITVYPNPFVDHFIVKCPAVIKSIEIYQINGNLAYRKDLSNEDESKEIKVETKDFENALPSGMYFIVVYTNEGIYRYKLNKI